MRYIIKARSKGGIDYLHSYHSSRPRVDWNRCGQAAVATLLDYHRLDPYALKKPNHDEKDSRRHWADGEIIDRICEDFPPNHLFGLFGTTPGQLAKALRFAGLEASWAASMIRGKGRQKVWEEVKRSVEAGLPVIVSMDMGKLGGPPLRAHWGVVYRIDDSYVHLANAKNLTMVPEARFLRAFECWFMLPRFHHCAVFARPRTRWFSIEAAPVHTARDGSQGPVSDAQSHASCTASSASASDPRASCVGHRPQTAPVLLETFGKPHVLVHPMRSLYVETGQNGRV